MNVRLHLDGVDKVRRHIRIQTARQRQNVDNLVRKAAFDVQAKAREVVPVVTGNLKASIQVHTVPGTLSAEVIAHAEYAAIVEYGYGRVAKPYMNPAVEQVAPSFIYALERIMENP